MTDLLDLSDWSHKLSNFALFGSSRTGAALELHDLWMVHCGFPETGFNTAFLKDPGKRLEQSIEAAESYFAGLGLPFSFHCRDDREELCVEALAAAGYARSEEIPVMRLDSIPAGSGSSTEGRDFRPVATSHSSRPEAN